MGLVKLVPFQYTIALFAIYGLVEPVGSFWIHGDSG